MFAMTKSFVACSSRRPLFTGTSLPSEERIDATTGLQTSSPMSADCRSGSFPARAHFLPTSS